MNLEHLACCRNLAFEQAYCCYRLNDIGQAEAILKNSPEDSPRKSELLAQIYYRQEHYEKCYDLYREVIKNSEDEWDSERQTNLLAISACLGFNGIVSIFTGLQFYGESMFISCFIYLTFSEEEHSGSNGRFFRAEL